MKPLWLFVCFVSYKSKRKNEVESEKGVERGQSGCVEEDDKNKRLVMPFEGIMPRRHDV